MSPLEDMTYVRDPRGGVPPDLDPEQPLKPSREPEPLPAAPSPGPSLPPAIVPQREQVPAPIRGDRTRLLHARSPGVAPLAAWLVVVSGAHPGRDYRLASEATLIGRSPECKVQLLSDDAVSRHHARVVLQGDTYVVQDGDQRGPSTNGTFVNGEQVSEKALQDGDRLRIGKTELVFTSLTI